MATTSTVASVGSMPTHEPMTSTRMSLYTACTEQNSEAWLMRLAMSEGRILPKVGSLSQPAGSEKLLATPARPLVPSEVPMAYLTSSSETIVGTV